MDLQTLSNLFTTTLNSNPNVRKAAELEIRRVGNEEGMITALLQIIASDSVDLATRQACSVWLKNRVYKHYSLEPTTKRRPDLVIIAQSDRDALKSSILPLLAAAPSRSISVQLASTLKNIIAVDFPSKWPGILQSVKGLLLSTNIREVHAGCIAALECVRAFRYLQNHDNLNHVISELFPTLVNIALQMLNTPPGPAQEIPTMLHLILKTYKNTLITELSAHQQSPESLVPWGRLLFAMVNLQLPKEAVPENEEEREVSEWWKAKKWAYGTLGRLFHRFGNPSQLPSTTKKRYGHFAQHFVTVFAPEILSTYLRQVDLFVSGQAWLSQKCQYQIFSFFIECVKPKSTWALLKPHFETLVSSFVFPHLTFTPSRKLLWEEDPVDYIRLTVDEYENYSSPVAAATSFLFALAGNRTKTTFMSILGFINSVLNANPTPEQRFGALNMTAALGPWIMRHPDVQNSMEGFILQNVTPALSAPEGYLRAISLEVVGTMIKNGLQFSTDENLNFHYRAIMSSFDDPQLPVKVQAALALTELVLSSEQVKAAVGPQVGKVIQDLLKMSDETDLDILNRCMEVMVDSFQAELLPVAAQLTARLCDSYLRLAKESTSHEEGSTTPSLDLDNLSDIPDDDKTFAAMGVAKTIGTIVSSIENAPEILAQVQEVIIPIIMYTFEHKLLDLFDNMYDLVDNLTFKLRSISPTMWPIFEATYKLFKSEAVDFLDEMLPSLDNFVSFGSDVIKTRNDYKEMLVDIYTTSINNPQLGENDRVNGCKLAESILLNLRGHIDEALPIITSTALGLLNKTETAALRLANLEVLINAILYNPSASLQIMEQIGQGQSRAFFDQWFAAINHADSKLPRVHDKKLSILALCALLDMDASLVPPGLQAGWAGIVGGVIRVFKDLPAAIDARKRLEEALAEESDEDDDEALLNLQGDDEDVWDEDSAYLELLAKEGERLRLKSQNGGASTGSIDGDEDEEESDEEIGEELGYISALDVVNPYVSFKQALTALQSKNGSLYQASTTALNVEQQTLLMEIMRLADTQEHTAVTA
ncbi:hypothetical protein AX16_004573 [Volvariella volvacea WC 439]|nr:hypothetical protein AX16_004573 [Volvariella volvacea WC 439]